MSTNHYDVIVIGAGPVGSHLASRLSAHGYKILVLDKNSKAGENVFCTGIISNECFKLLDPGSDIRYRELHTATLYSPQDKTINFNRKIPIAVIVDRPQLNISLAQRASLSGAEFLFSATVTSIEKRNNQINVNVKIDGTSTLFNASIAVIAAGYGTGLIKQLQLGNIKDYIIGAQAEVDVPSEMDLTEIYMDHSIAPGGFAWFTHKWDNKGLAGMLCSRDPRFHQQQFLDKLLKSGRINSIPIESSFTPVPLNVLKRTFDDRILVVGEAAGQIKPTTGGGIYYGLLCADIACTIIEEAFQLSDFSTSQMQKYQYGWKKLLQKEISTGKFLQKTYAALPDSLINIIFNIMLKRNVSGFINDSSELYFDRHSMIVRQIIRRLLSFNKNK